MEGRFSLKTARKIFAAVAFVGFFGGATASAAPITIEQYLFDYLFDPGTSDPGLLMVLADMGPAGTALRIALAQASCDVAESDQESPARDSASQHEESTDWECDSSSPMTSRFRPFGGRTFRGGGMRTGGGTASHGNAVGALQSIITNPFAGGSFADGPIGQPPNLGGPGFDLSSGLELLGGLETDRLGNSVEPRNDYLTLVLGSTVPENLFGQIPTGNASVPFNSPKPPVEQVPEPSSFLLSALAIAGFGLMTRRRLQRRES